MSTLAILEILLLVNRSVLGAAQRVPGSKRVKNFEFTLIKGKLLLARSLVS